MKIHTNNISIPHLGISSTCVIIHKILSTSRASKLEVGGGADTEITTGLHKAQCILAIFLPATAIFVANDRNCKSSGNHNREQAIQV